MTYPRKNLLTLPYTDQQDLWFRKEGNKNLGVFLHGMYSTPSTFEDFALYFRVKHPHWDIYCPALPAGTKDVQVLAKLGPWAWEESLAVARHKAQEAAQGYETVVLGGHSQGGSLALALAPDFDFLKALVIVSSPLVLGGKNLSWDENLGIALASLLCLLTPKGIKKPVPYTAERASLEKLCDAEGLVFPLTIATFKEGLKKLRPRLKEISLPLFTAYCLQDKLVSPFNAQLLAEEVSSSLIIQKMFDIPKSQEPFGRKHQLLNYTKTKGELFSLLTDFLHSL